jgi:hypothetical protein
VGGAAPSVRNPDRISRNSLPELRKPPSTFEVNYELGGFPRNDSNGKLFRHQLRAFQRDHFILPTDFHAGIPRSG